MKKPHTSDDEFIWDDYHGDFLNDEFSISTTSDDFGLTVSRYTVLKKCLSEFITLYHIPPELDD